GKEEETPLICPPLGALISIVLLHLRLVISKPSGKRKSGSFRKKNLIFSNGVSKSPSLSTSSSFFESTRNDALWKHQNQIKMNITAQVPAVIRAFSIFS